MIRVRGAERLTAVEAYGLDLLLDQARLLPVDDPAAAVPELRVVEGREPASLQAAVGREWGIAVAQDQLTIERPMLAAIGRIAGLVAEQESGAADRRGRVPSEVNALVAAGASDRADVGRAAGLLRARVQGVAGRRPFRQLPAWPDGRRWAAAFSHDVDVLAWWPAFAALRGLELLRKGELRRLMTVTAAAATTWRNAALDGVRAVLDVERRHGIRSTWFFLCDQPTIGRWSRGDVTYAATGRAMRTALDLVAASGGEIGLHGSFETTEQAGLHAAQRERLRGLSGQAVRGVRQHFLRLKPGPTYHHMLAAGFEYDATLGFADRNGFRLGYADVGPLWDAAAGQALPLLETPLVWMDRALSKYGGVEDPARWVEAAQHLAAECEATGGLWVGLWHPNLTAPLGYPGALDAYEDLCPALAGRSPYLCTLEEAVTWRRVRRSLRARTVTAAGDVVLDGSGEGGRVPLLDADGRVAQDAAWSAPA